MDQRRASELARDMADFYARETGSPGVRNEVLGAIFSQLYEFVPEEAVAGMIQRDGDNAPIIAAVEGGKLYTVKYLGESGSSPFVAAKCSMVHLDPVGAAVTVEARYQEAQTGPETPPRSAVWRFALDGGDTLTIETIIGADREADDRELLSRALARALGWRSEQLG